MFVFCNWMVLDEWGELVGHKRSLTHHTQISKLDIQCHISYFSILIFLFLHFLSHCSCTLFTFLSHYACTLNTFSTPLRLVYFCGNFVVFFVDCYNMLCVLLYIVLILLLASVLNT